MNLFSYFIKSNKIDYINRLRINRALFNCSNKFKLIYKFLPILLNYNNPVLPGFIDNQVPFGICFFFPDFQQKNFLKMNKLNFYSDKIYYLMNNNLPIIGIYSMGSTSSIAQNKLSDLDFWVIHQNWIISKKKKLLKKKCLLIEKWANSLGIKTNIFLVSENYFKINNKYNINNINKNINIILLDEFYRTAVRIAGKKLLWMITETNKEDQYKELVYLNKKKKFFHNEWLDLGFFKKITYKDCVYGILSFLYKSFNSPFKLILKSALLEYYILNCSNEFLLSVEYKKLLHSEKKSFHGLDAYCLMLEKITCYLKKIQDFDKLDLMRCFFYLKVSEKLSRKNLLKNNWKRFILLKLVSSWNWSIKKITMLDNGCYFNKKNIQELSNEFIFNTFKKYRKYI